MSPRSTRPSAKVAWTLRQVGHVYSWVGPRWAEHLDGLSDDQVAFAAELFSQATDPTGRS